MGEQVAAGFPWGISSVGRAPALQAGGHEFESRILHADNKSCEIQQKHPIVLAQMRMRMVDFIGRQSVIEMKRSEIEIHDDCLICTLKIAYKK